MLCVELAWGLSWQQGLAARYEVSAEALKPKRAAQLAGTSAQNRAVRPNNASQLTVQRECFEVFLVFQGFKDDTFKFTFRVDFTFLPVSKAEPNWVAVNVSDGGNARKHGLLQRFDSRHRLVCASRYPGGEQFVLVKRAPLLNMGQCAL